MALLDIVQGIARRAGYPQPSAAFPSGDPNIQLMIDCVQDAGDEMAERVDWQALKFQAPVTFTGDGVTAAFQLPIDFQRLSPSDTFISSIYPTLRMPGPVGEDQLLRMKALPMSLFPSAWRQVAGLIEFYPVLAAGEIVSYVYARGLWITDLNGAPYSPAVWKADTDLSLLSQRVLRLGGVAKWKRRRGLDYAQEMDEYEAALDRVSSQEDTGLVIAMADDMGPTDTWPGIISSTADPTYSG